MTLGNRGATELPVHRLVEYLVFSYNAYVVSSIKLQEFDLAFEDHLLTGAQIVTKVFLEVGLGGREVELESNQGILKFFWDTREMWVQS
jgi:hypothetical protein